MKGILGRKVGMTQLFTSNGNLIPVTIVEVKPNVVTNVLTNEKMGMLQPNLHWKTKKDHKSKNLKLTISKKQAQHLSAS